MASPVGTSFLDHFAALRDPRQGWKVVFPLSDDEAPRLEAPAEIDITTVILARKQPVGLGPATCVASEPETWTAFAILSGISSEALAGEQILIDQNAWLRAAWRPGGPGNLTNPQALAAVVRDIAPHPIAADAASSLLHCYDEPETLPSSIQPRCLIGADAEHIGHRIVMPRQPATDRNYASNTSLAEPASHQLINDRKQKQNVQSNAMYGRYLAVFVAKALGFPRLTDILLMCISGHFRRVSRRFVAFVFTRAFGSAYNALIIQPSPPARHEGLGGIDTLSGEPGPSPAVFRNISRF